MKGTRRAWPKGSIPFLATVAFLVVVQTVAAQSDSGAMLRRIEKQIRQEMRQHGLDERDLVSQQDVKRLLDQLQKQGLQVPDSRKLVDSALPQSDFLLQHAKTPEGREFLRKVAGYPSGMDRLDRLRRLPRGERMVRDLVRGPDGYKMLEYMATTPYGRNLGNQLSNTPKGRQFNQATGRIYTVDDLVEQVKRALDRQDAKR